MTCWECGKFKDAGRFGSSRFCHSCLGKRNWESKKRHREKESVLAVLATNHYSRWTQEEEALLKNMAKGEPIAPMAVKLGRTYGSIVNRLALVTDNRKRARKIDGQWVIWFAEPEPRPDFEWDDEEISA